MVWRRPASVSVSVSVFVFLSPIPATMLRVLERKIRSMSGEKRFTKERTKNRQSCDPRVLCEVVISEFGDGGE